MTDPADNESPHIGTLREKSLHASLKQWYARTGDALEVRVENYVIDLVREADSGLLLVEFQTGNFSNIKKKLEALLNAGHRVHVVHPVTVARWIVKFSDGRRISRRKSPLKNTVHRIFRELVYIPHIVPHSRFSLEVLLVHEEEIRVDDGKGSWRRKGWSIADRRLLDVVASHRFESPADLAALLPDNLPQPFTTADIAKAIKQPRRLAGQVAYCLHAIDTLERTGKQGNAILYQRKPPSVDSPT